MKILRATAVFALLIAPAYAQAPHINMLSEIPSKTDEEKEADAVKDKAYQESLRKIPDVKVTDPWGSVRSDTPKASPAKPRTKTGSTAN